MPAKVNKVKFFSGPCYIIKHILTLVSGAQESVLVNFISQNKVKILIKVKICQNCFIEIPLLKQTNYFFLYFSEFLSNYQNFMHSLYVFE